jgi:hypothetical protein
MKKSDIRIVNPSHDIAWQQLIQRQNILQIKMVIIEPFDYTIHIPMCNQARVNRR